MIGKIYRYKSYGSDLILHGNITTIRLDKIRREWRSANYGYTHWCYFTRLEWGRSWFWTQIGSKVKPTTLKLIFAASLLLTQYHGIRANTCSFGIRRIWVILFFTAILQRFDLIKSQENDDLPTMGIHTGATLQPQPFKMCFRQRTWENIWFSMCLSCPLSKHTLKIKSSLKSFV
jgi:hypothetical protein